MTAPLRLVWSDGHEVTPRAPDGIECNACGRTYVDRDLYDRHSCREAVRADRVEARESAAIRAVLAIRRRRHGSRRTALARRAAVIVLALVAGLLFGALIASGRLP